jgi:hypothetical protein
MFVRVSSGFVAALILLTWARIVHAHDGHGNPQWFGSLLHYVFEPVHLALSLAAIVGLALAIWASRGRARPRQRSS